MSESDLSVQRRVDRICDQFEDEWSANGRPDIRAFLEQIDKPHRQRLLEALLDTDVELREKAGLTIEPVDYQNLGDDAVAHVRGLVTSRFATIDQSSNKILPDESIRSAPPPELSTPKRIGPYKLLQQIGEGGMGTVWMADQQEPFRRRVALKVIKAGMDSKQVIARFEAERQALAMMDHQNIAKVLDAGTTEDGRPYFAMELVDGIPITEYCDKNRLTPNERLELFESVCNAIQHAHQKGIIHRDIKPSNVLVTLYDGKPVPKVIDFGLAKALQHQTQLTDKTMFTEFGQAVGTWLYMSPEQAERSGVDVDTRTDIYSLGVLLYELLTGSTPLERETIREQGWLKIVELIRDREPPRPSTRLSDSGDAISGISQQRKIAPTRLQQILRGELDWVVMKALEKDRTRRYETASALAEDLNHYLKNEPVEARPPSRTYLFKKSFQKHRVAILTSIMILALLVAAVAGTTTGWLRARQLAISEGVAKQKAINNEIEATEQKNRADEFAASLEGALSDEKTERDRAEKLLYQQNIRRAQDSWERGEVDAAILALNSCAWHLRGWEHDYLHSKFNHGQTTWQGHPGSITALAFKPDGTQFVSVCDKGFLNVWDADSNTLVTSLGAFGEGYSQPVRSIEFSPDGNRIVTAGSHVIVWDTATWEVSYAIATPVQNGVTYVGEWANARFSPTGRRLAIRTVAGPVHIHDAVSGEVVSRIIASQSSADFAFSPDGLQIATSGPDGFALWEVETAKEIRKVSTLPLEYSRLLWVSDQQLVGVGTRIHFWNLDESEDSEKRESRIARTDVGYCVDRNLLALARDGKSVKLVDFKTRKTIASLHGHRSRVSAIGWHPDGNRLITSSSGFLKSWDINLILSPPPFKSQYFRGTADAVKKDVRWLVMKEAGELIVRSAKSGEQRYSIPIESSTAAETQSVPPIIAPTKTFAFCHAQERVYLAGGAGIEVWSIDPLEKVQSLVGHGGKVHGVWIRPDGLYLASWAENGEMLVWDTATGLPVFKRELIQSSFGGAVSFSPIGPHLVVSSNTTHDAPAIWDFLAGNKLEELSIVPNVDTLAWSPDGKKIAGAFGEIKWGDHIPGSGRSFWSSAGRQVETVRRANINEAGNDVIIWNAKTGKIETVLSKHQGFVKQIAFNQDGTRLASQDRSDRTIVWDLTTGHALLDLPGNENISFRDDCSLHMVDNGLVIRRQTARKYFLEGAAKLSNVVFNQHNPEETHAAALEELKRLYGNIASPEYLIVLAMAQYRLGQYGPARDSVQQAVSLSSDPKFLDSHPRAIAILAMACQQLGEPQQANELKKRFSTLLEKDRYKYDPVLYNLSEEIRTMDN